MDGYIANPLHYWLLTLFGGGGCLCGARTHTLLGPKNKVSARVAECHSEKIETDVLKLVIPLHDPLQETM